MAAAPLRFFVSTVLMRFVGNEQISVLGFNMSGVAQRPALCHQEFNVAQIYIYIYIKTTSQTCHETVVKQF